ncbi:MAG: hypothetical protein H7287_07400 [Thermoleophilia bacterium]|nr:hypothetical protein [Thermoleophilia bacterium]
MASPTSVNTGQEPSATTHASSANALTSKLNSLFTNTFQSNLQTVFTRGAAGEFDDAKLTLAEQAAMTKLELARRTPAPTTGSVGANAAPSAGVVGGGPTGESAATVAAERDVFQARVAQSEARLQNISTKLRSEYPEAAALASASTGTWDPATYRPKTKAGVTAFAQRMVIGATEGAARLDIVKNELDAARLEAKASPSTAGTGLVTKLEADFKRQQDYVRKLAKIVDGASEGLVTDAGKQALAGTSLRTEGDVSATELAKEMRKNGFSEADIATVVGQGELAVEEDTTDGGSQRLRQVVDQSITTLMLKFEREQSGVRREAEEKRAEQKRLDGEFQAKHDEQHYFDQQADNQASELRANQHALDEHAASQHAGERQAALNAYLQSRAS